MDKSTLLAARKRELDRINFISQRDGINSAIHFAKRTLFLYYSALRFVNKDPSKAKHHFSRSPEYLSEYMGSVMELKKFLIGHNESS